MPTKTKTIAAKPMSKKHLLAPGHRACAGCGQIVAARTVAEALGPNTIVANATGCLEVTTTPYPESAWGMPWIHSLFENASAIASGVSAALRYKQRIQNSIRQPADKIQNSTPRVIAQGGDGGTFDIGFGLISGMWERGENIIYICYDNEAYANTGVQASGATPWGAHTTTTPSGRGTTIDAIGSHQRKKDMIAIALAHGLKYVAQTTVGYLPDITKKVKRAMETEGPAYIQILSTCVPGWKTETGQTMSIARLAAQTGLYPSVEYTNGVLTDKIKVPSPAPKVDEYLKLQPRFAHLFKSKQGREQLAYIQSIADGNIAKYELA